MAQYDGSIRINTEIGYRNAKKELKALESSIEKTAEKIASLRSKMDALKDVKIPTQEYKELQEYIDSLSKQYGKLFSNLQKMKSEGKKGTEEYQRIKEEFLDIGSSIRQARNELRTLVDTGKAFTLGSDTEKYAEMSAQVERLNQQMRSDTERQVKLQSQIAEREKRLAELKENAVASNQRIIKTVERIKQLEQEIADLKTVGRTEGFADYDNRIKELSKLKQDVNKYRDRLSEVPERFSRMRASAQKAFDAIRSGLSKNGSIGKKAFSGIFNMAKKAFSAITSGSKQSNASLSGGLKTILKYGLGIRSLYALFSKIRSGIQQGFKNLMDYSGDFANSIQSVKNSMSTLGNQIAAAFAPIVQMVIPWLNQLINVLSTAMSYVAQFIAILGGKSTFTRAKQVQDSYNKSLNGTAAAAKKAYGALAKFDDLDVLQKQEDTSGGGAGEIVGDMFEEVPIDSKIIDILKWLKDMWENSDFYELGKLLGEKLKEALDNIPWDKIKETARKIGKSIASLINGFIEVEGLGYSIGRTLAEAMNTGFEFLNAFVHELHWESIGHFIADTLNGFFENIDWELIKDTFITGFKGLADAINQFIADFHWDNISDAISNLVNIIAESIYIFFSTTHFDELGQKLGEQLRKSIEKIDWEMVGMSLGSVIQAALDFLISFVKEQDMSEIAQAIIDTLKGSFKTIDAGDLVAVILAVIATKLALKATGFVFQAAAGAILSGLSKAFVAGLSGFETIARLIISGIAGTFLTLSDMALTMAKGLLDLIKLGLSMSKTAIVDIGSLLINGISSGIAGAGGIGGLLTADLGTLITGGSIATAGVAIGTALIGGIIAAIAGWNFGQWLYEKITGEEIGMTFTEQVKEIFSSFTDGSWVEAFKMWGSDIVEGLKLGVLNAFSTIGNWINEHIFQPFVIGFKVLFAVMPEIGSYIIEGLLLGIQESWAYITEWFSTVFEELILLFSEECTNIKDNVLEIWNSLKESFAEIWEGMKTIFEGIITFLTGVFTGNWQKAWDGITKIFEGVKDTVKGIINGILGFVESLANGVINAINAVIRALNALSFDVPDWIPGIGGETFGFDLSEIPNVSIPKLATGAVIRGGNPFMAILGDQPAGKTNIEAPAGLIKDMVAQGIAEAGIGSRENIPVNINIIYDGETTARVMIPDILSELSRQGYNVDLLGYT